jgi:hypothetical protein
VQKRLAHPGGEFVAARTYAERLLAFWASIGSKPGLLQNHQHE